MHAPVVQSWWVQLHPLTRSNQVPDLHIIIRGRYFCILRNVKNSANFPIADIERASFFFASHCIPLLHRLKNIKDKRSFHPFSLILRFETQKYSFQLCISLISWGMLIFSLTLSSGRKVFKTVLRKYTVSAPIEHWRSINF